MPRRAAATLRRFPDRSSKLAAADPAAQIQAALRAHGLLLITDPKLPSVAALVVGEPVRGSWWAHPRASEIYRALAGMTESQDVTTAKLLAGKVTLVHRRLWPALLGVATSGAPWQRDDLSRNATLLLRDVERAQTLRIDEVQRGASGPWNDAARELELRLLVHAEEQHGESGAHTKSLETWARWAERSHAGAALPPDAGMAALADAVKAMCSACGARVKLPWQ